MRHGRKVKKLGRPKSHRKAMLYNMAASLLTHIQIKTTLAKAKEVKKVVDRLVTLAKRGDLSAKRQAYDIIREHSLVKKLFEEIGPKFKERNGGYTRLMRYDTRLGDGAQLAVVELLMGKPVKVKKEKGKEKKEKEKKEEKVEAKKGKERKASKEKEGKKEKEEKVESEVIEEKKEETTEEKAK